MQCNFYATVQCTFTPVLIFNRAWWLSICAVKLLFFLSSILNFRKRFPSLPSWWQMTVWTWVMSTSIKTFLKKLQTSQLTSSQTWGMTRTTSCNNGVFDWLTPCNDIYYCRYYVHWAKLIVTGIIPVLSLTYLNFRIYNKIKWDRIIIDLRPPSVKTIPMIQKQPPQFTMEFNRLLVTL